MQVYTSSYGIWYKPPFRWIWILWALLFARSRRKPTILALEEVWIWVLLYPKNLCLVGWRGKERWLFRSSPLAKIADRLTRTAMSDTKTFPPQHYHIPNTIVLLLDSPAKGRDILDNRPSDVVDLALVQLQNIGIQLVEWRTLLYRRLNVPRLMKVFSP